MKKTRVPLSLLLILAAVMLVFSLGACARTSNENANSASATNSPPTNEADDWRQASAQNTVVSYQRYIAAHPSGSSVAEARAKVDSLRQDDAPYQATRQQNSRQAFQQFLAEFPGHRREPEIRALLEDAEGRDIVDLLEQRKIEAETRGSSIEDVVLNIRRLADHEITVRIPVGTFFRARNSSAQNMVATEARNVTLRDSARVSVTVRAACANLPRDIPGSSDTFQIVRASQNRDLQKLMPALQSANANNNVRQAAVWIVTDNANFNALGTLVDGLSSARVINEYEAASAMRILDQAGVDITRRAIWNDRRSLIRELPDGELKTWLQQRADSGRRRTP